MTLIWQLMVGAGIILIAAGLEGISPSCAVQWIWNGAGSTFPSGCTPASTTGQINTSGTSGVTGIPIQP